MFAWLSSETTIFPWPSPYHWKSLENLDDAWDCIVERELTVALHHCPRNSAGSPNELSSFVHLIEFVFRIIGEVWSLLARIQIDLLDKKDNNSGRKDKYHGLQVLRYLVPSNFWQEQVVLSGCQQWHTDLEIEPFSHIVALPTTGTGITALYLVVTSASYSKPHDHDASDLIRQKLLVYGKCTVSIYHWLYTTRSINIVSMHSENNDFQ